ncbi:MAG: GerMN domain-containing protein [Clostridia bacterium]|nr:GerMN domain-containing protein [Clostridia bacterium]
MKKFICVLLMFILIVSFCACSNKTLQYTAKLYFVNLGGTELVSETRDVIIPDGESIAKCVMIELMKGPKNPEYKAIIPKDATLNDVILTGDLAIVDFSADVYLEDDADILLLSTSVLRTIAEIEGISRVLITVDGGDFVNSQGNTIGIMNKADIVYDTTPEVKQQQYLTLYFANKDGSYLVDESRRITINEKESVEIQALRELIKGPKSKNSSRTIPQETKILSVETKEGICFVNLSQEFISRHTGGTASEQLTIYSIVNTLTELEGVEKVQFLIEGQKSESFIHMLINEPFVRDEGIIE